MLDTLAEPKPSPHLVVKDIDTECRPGSPQVSLLEKSHNGGLQPGFEDTVSHSFHVRVTEPWLSEPRGFKDKVTLPTFPLPEMRRQ